MGWANAPHNHPQLASRGYTVDNNRLSLEYKPYGPKRSAMVTAKLGAATIAIDKIDCLKASDRDRFAERLCTNTEINREGRFTTIGD